MRVTNTQLKELVQAAVREHGLPPTLEILATWLPCGIQRLRRHGNIRQVLQFCDISCDCLPASSSQFERSVYTLLRTEFDEEDIVYQHTFADCRARRALPFDFYVRSIKLVIEADGTQHYGKGKQGWGDRCRETDAIKNAYCQQHNIALLRVRFRRFRWNKNDLIAVIKSLRLHARETGHANCFNCWDGSGLIPISSRACIQHKPKTRVEVTRSSHVEYKVFKDDALLFTALLDTSFYDEMMNTTSLYLKKGKLYVTSNGTLAANTVLQLRGSSKFTIRHKNNNTFDLRKENLEVVPNSEMPRTRRLTKRSVTGIVGIHLGSGVVKGKRYHTVTAVSHRTKKSKTFGVTRIGLEEAMRRAKHWLQIQEGSTTIPKGSTLKRVETGSTQTGQAVGDDIVCSAGNT